MSAWSRAGIAALSALFILGGQVSHGAAKPESLKVKTGALSGVVMDSAGKPLPNVLLQLKQDDRVIAAVKSGEKGQYALENVPAGPLELMVAGRSPIKLIGQADAEVAQLRIVIPQSGPYSAADLPVLTQTQWIWVAAGAGAAVVIAVPVVITSSGGGSSGGGTSHGTVSP